MKSKRRPLTDLLSAEQARSLLNTVYDVTGVTAWITDPQGRGIAASRRSDVCTLFHRSNDETLAQCTSNDHEIARQMLAGSSRIRSDCRNGMAVAGSPLLIDGDCVGYCFIGQFLPGRPERNCFSTRARQCAFDEALYLEAVSRVPVLDSRAVDATLSLLVRMTCQAAEAGLARRRLRDALEEHNTAKNLTPWDLPLATAVEQADEIIFITDIQSSFIYVNPAFERITGYARTEILGRHISALGNPRHPTAFYKNIQTALQSGQPWKGRLTCGKKDGSAYETETTISPITTTTGSITHYVCVQRDVTREMDLQRQLRQSQKMEALGTLAGGIAHDFNNILAAIIGYADMTADEIGTNASAAHNLQQIKKAGKRAKDLVRQILAFSRQSDHTKRPVKLAGIFADVLNMLRATLPSTITIDQHLASTSYLMADTTQMHQLLMNLCTNAAHAMPDKSGTITISLDDVTVSHITPTMFQPMPPGQYIRLTVSDTGTGIKPDIIERIFDPFFTTQAIGDGTGMGLALVHGIMENHAGFIAVESSTGTGSTFMLYLPRTEQSAREARAAPATLPGSNERVLFVDDEADVTAVAEKILGSLGYAVVATTSSLKALSLFKNNPAGFDVVVTDQTMPHKTGFELARDILRIRPDVPVVLCTGYSAQITEQQVLQAGIRALVLKPLDRRELGEAVYTALHPAAHTEVPGTPPVA
jgi:PAS domain S-box-containing protein